MRHESRQFLGKEIESATAGLGQNGTGFLCLGPEAVSNGEGPSQPEDRPAPPFSIL